MMAEHYGVTCLLSVQIRDDGHLIFRVVNLIAENLIGILRLSFSTTATKKRLSQAFLFFLDFFSELVAHSRTISPYGLPRLVSNWVLLSY